MCFYICQPYWWGWPGHNLHKWPFWLFETEKTKRDTTKERKEEDHVLWDKCDSVCIFNSEAHRISESELWFYPFTLGWKTSSSKLIAQNYVSKMTAGLKQTINNGNTTTGCLALFIQSWWLISYLECISCCGINELWLQEAFPSEFLNDSAWVTTVIKINSFTCSVCCDWTTNHVSPSHKALRLCTE